MFPPGLAKLATNPLPRGSDTIAKTIGMVLVSDCNAAVDGVKRLTRTSGFSPTNSLANICTRPALPAPQRQSTRMLRPSVQPKSVSRFRNAASSTCASASVSAKRLKTPMRRIWLGCCALATSGQAMAVLPRSATKSRRLIILTQG